ncbi:AIM24 family protein [Bacillus glycinifermentans]|uniref:AIM24 family protein n=1 Tax=Bacillus glycinifermentans TaxID=1664069 RepID=UPI0022E73777|nr:AIM24 family protein [Bacillus glycinifermentans]
MSFHFDTVQELTLKAEGSGRFFAKKGAMIADQGQLKYSKRLLGTNQGNIVKQVFNHLSRKLTGENLEMMEVTGRGVCYLADQGEHVTVINLEPNGIWQSVSVESEDLLAFTEDCHYGVTPVGVGVLSQKGLFTSKLTYNGTGAQVAVKTAGNPLILESPCRVDPDAIVAWTGPAPKVTLDVNWKTVIGQTSGESYMFEFQQPGQIVIVQPFERQSGLKVGLDDNRYKAETQNSAWQNTRQGMTNQPEHHGQDQGGLGGIVGSILNNRR